MNVNERPSFTPLIPRSDVSVYVPLSTSPNPQSATEAIPSPPPLLLSSSYQPRPIPSDPKDSYFSFYEISELSEETLIKLGLCYEDQSFDTEESLNPADTPDLESLAEGTLRFLKTSVKTFFKKKSIVVSYIPTKKKLYSHDYCYLYNLFTSLRNAGFPLWYYTHKGLVPIKNDKQLNILLNDLAHVSESQLYESCTKAKISKEQVFWVNWSNPGFLENELNEIESESYPPILEHYDYVSNLPKSSLSYKTALSIFTDPKAIQAISPQQMPQVEIAGNKESLEKIFHFLKTFPNNTTLKLDLELENIEIIPLFLPEVPQDKTLILEITLEEFRDEPYTFSLPEDIESLNQLLPPNSPVSSNLKEVLDDFETDKFHSTTPYLQNSPISTCYHPTDTHSEVPLSATYNLYELDGVLLRDKSIEIVCPLEAIRKNDPKKLNIPRFITIDRTVKILQLNMSVAKIEFKLQGAIAIEKLSLHNYSDHTPFKNLSFKESLTNTVDLLIKTAPTLKCLNIDLSKIQTIKENCHFQQNFYIELIQAISQVKFPNLETIKLYNIPFFIEDLVQLLEQCPSLKMLSIDISSNTPLSSENNAPLNMGQKIYPSLQFLEIKSRNPHQAPFTNVLTENLLKLAKPIHVLNLPDYPLSHLYKFNFPHLKVLKILQDMDIKEEFLESKFPNLNLCVLNNIKKFSVNLKAESNLRLMYDYITHQSRSIKSKAFKTYSRFTVDGGETQKQYKVKKYFENDLFPHQRESIYQLSWVKKKVYNKLLKPKMIPYTLPNIADSKNIPGKLNTLLSNNWTLLINLSSTDSLVNIISEDIALSDLEFSIDPDLNLYFVRLKQGINPKLVTLTYFLTERPFYEPAPLSQNPITLFTRFSENGPHSDLSLWPKEPFQRIDTIIHFLRGIKRESSGSIETDKLNNQLNRILEKQAGIACEGRSQLFCLIAPTVVEGLTCRMVKNNCHAYVEFKYNNQFYSVDLGGYEADVEFISTSVTPKDNPTATEIDFQAPLAKGVVDLKSLETPTFKSFATLIFKGLLKIDSINKQALLLASERQLADLHLQFLNIAKTHNLLFSTLSIKKRELYGIKTEHNAIVRTDTVTSKVLKEGGLLFLDLTDLSAANIACLLLLTDTQNRKIGDIDVHPETIIVAYLPSFQKVSPDIGRRFAMISEVPDLPLSNNPLGSIVTESRDITDIKDPITLDLYQDPSLWRSALIGTFNEEMQWAPGLLLKAVKEGKPLVLKNPPKEPSLMYLLRGLNSGYYFASGEMYLLPPEFRVFVVNEKPSSSSINVTYGYQEGDLVLNQSTFPQFLSLVKANGGRFAKEPGIVSGSMDPHLSIRLTSDLSFWQWKQLLDIKKTWGIDPLFIIPKDLPVPYFINLNNQDYFSSLDSSLENLITTPDTALTVQDLLKVQKEAQVIRITPFTRAHDFIPALVNKSSDSFNFQVETGEIWEMLSEGGTVILHGNFSSLLINELTPLVNGSNKGVWVNGEFFPLKGKLILVVDSSQNLNYLITTSKTVTQDRVDEELGLSFQSHEISSARQLLTQAGLKADFRALKSLIRYRQNQIMHPLTYFDAGGVNPITYNKRIDAALSLWKVSSVIYFYGPPASGKSHFIYEVLPKNVQGSFYYSEKSIGTFLSDPGLSVLCLDEGDLTPNLVDSLVALNDNPKTFWYRRKLYRFTGEKKVIITGNGQFSGRGPPSFISSYGGAIYFPELTYPVISATILPKEIPESFKRRLLELYQEAQKQNLDVGLRDLKTISAYYFFYQNAWPKTSDLDLADLSFLEVCSDVDSLQGKKGLYDERKLAWLDHLLKGSDWNQSFALTNSRKKVLWRIHTLLWLRYFNISGAQKGMLLVGPAGEGKTDLIQKYLHAFKISDYLMINMTDDPDTVKKALHAAFHEGKIVIVDELDGLYEECLNSYLTGRDMEGQPALKEGFFVFGTANGADYNLRLPRSEAFDSRFIKEIMPSYTDEELLEILNRLGVDQAMAKEWIQDHNLKLKSTPHEILKPTPADLFIRAKVVKNQPEREIDFEVPNEKRVRENDLVSDDMEL